MTPVAPRISLKIITSHVLNISRFSKAVRKNGCTSKSENLFTKKLNMMQINTAIYTGQ